MNTGGVQRTRVRHEQKLGIRGEQTTGLEVNKRQDKR